MFFSLCCEFCNDIIIIVSTGCVLRFIPYFLICPKVKLRLETFDIAIANSG